MTQLTSSHSAARRDVKCGVLAYSACYTMPFVLRHVKPAMQYQAKACAISTIPAVSILGFEGIAGLFPRHLLGALIGHRFVSSNGIQTCVNTYRQWAALTLWQWRKSCVTPPRNLDTLLAALGWTRCSMWSFVTFASASSNESHGHSSIFWGGISGDSIDGDRKRSRSCIDHSFWQTGLAPELFRLLCCGLAPCGPLSWPVNLLASTTNSGFQSPVGDLGTQGHFSTPSSLDVSGGATLSTTFYRLSKVVDAYALADDSTTVHQQGVLTYKLYAI